MQPPPVDAADWHGLQPRQAALACCGGCNGQGKSLFTSATSGSMPARKRTPGRSCSRAPPPRTSLSKRQSAGVGHHSSATAFRKSYILRMNGALHRSHRYHDERSNRLLPQVQACTDNIGCALPRPVSSGSFAMPARQRRRSQRPCTKPYGICAHVRSGEAVAGTVDEPAAGRPVVAGAGPRAKHQPARRFDCFLGGRLGRSPCCC